MTKEKTKFLLKKYGINLTNLERLDYISNTLKNTLNKGFSEAEGNKGHHIYDNHLEELNAAIIAYLEDAKKDFKK